MQKQYEARVTPLKQTAAQKEAKAQKEAEEQKLWEARRAKAQELYSAAQVSLNRGRCIRNLLIQRP